jgi:hypothetical protein
LNSKIWKTKLGVEPVCLLFGSRANTNMSEEFGKIIEVPLIEDMPLLIQITWSKFYWPILEPEATWLIGDIDLLPLSTWWFTDRLASIPPDHYAHLDADGITQLNGTRFTWANKRITPDNQTDLGCPTNMPGHYHCAKGRISKIALEQNGTFDQEIRHIVTSGQFNNERGYRDSDPIDQSRLWCAEELRSTRAIRRSIFGGRIAFTGLHLNHGIGRIDGDRLDKSCYDFAAGRYNHDAHRLETGSYADLHCIRPFDHVNPDERERRWKATETIVQTAWNDPTLTR